MQQITWFKFSRQTGAEMHVNCMRRYTDKKDIERCRCKNFSKATSTIKRKNDRISIDGLNERDLYLLCNKESRFVSSSKNKNFEGVKVKTFEFTKSIKQCCIKRSDQWGFTVLGTVEYKMADLHAADCVYHRSCCVYFRTGKQVKVHSSFVKSICS